MQNETFDYWVYDEYLLDVKKINIDKQMPVGTWLPALVGNGYFMCVNSLQEAKRVASEDILTKINNLKDALDSINNHVKD